MRWLDELEALRSELDEVQTRTLDRAIDAIEREINAASGAFSDRHAHIDTAAAAIRARGEDK